MTQDTELKPLSTSATVGFVGIGNIGYPMASTLLEAGYSVTATDTRDAALVKFADAGGRRASTPAAVATESDTVHVVVRSGEQVRDVVHGDDGVFSGFAAGGGGTLVVHSTVHPETCTDLVPHAPSGVSVVDAPVSGGQPRAESGDLSIMVGGEDAAVRRVRPVLAAMAREVYHMGPVGTGAVTKLSNNLVAGINLMGLLEGLRVGDAYGIERGALLEVMGESAGTNFWVENWDFFTEELGEVHPGGYEGVAEISTKDLRLALELAGDYDVQTPGLALARQSVPDFWRELGENEPTAPGSGAPSRE